MLLWRKSRRHHPQLCERNCGAKPITEYQLDWGNEPDGRWNRTPPSQEYAQLPPQQWSRGEALGSSNEHDRETVWDKKSLLSSHYLRH